MHEAERLQAAAAKALDRGLSVAELEEAIEEKLAAKAHRAARETTSRSATAEPRPEAAPVSPPAAPRPVTAQELFGDVPPALQAKANKKTEYPVELLDDPKALKMARHIVNANNYRKRRGNVVLSPAEAEQVRLADRFIQQSKTRRQRLQRESRKLGLGPG